MAIVDSSALIHLFDGTEEGEQIKKKYGQEMNAITAITLHEVAIGVHPQRREIADYFMSRLEVLPFDKEAAEKSVEIELKLRKRGRLINRADIFIAAICLINNMTLITTDNDFLEIDGLKVLMP